MPNNNHSLIALNSGFSHTNIAVRYLSQIADIPFMELNINMKYETILEKLSEFKALYFSCYIFNIALINRLICDLKKIDSNVHIVLGGPQVSFNAIELMKTNPNIDVIVMGEGEEIISALINRQYKGLKGVIYREKGEVLGEEYFNYIKNLDTLPFPYKEPPTNKLAYIETSRGCPFSCTYCMSGFTNDPVRYMSLEKIQEFIDKFYEYKVKIVKFVDRTFNCNKKRAKDIIKLIISKDYKMKFHFEIGGDLLDNETIELLNSKPELFQVEVGIQSFNEETLKAISRPCNIEKLCENVRALSIHKHVDLIAGLPFEDLDSFKQSFNLAYNLGADMLQLGFLKVLPGTTIDEFGIVYSSYPPFRVLSTPWISFSELSFLSKVETCLDIYYNSNKYKLTLPFVQGCFTTPFNMYEHLAKYINTDNPLGQKAATQSLYTSLCPLLSEEDKETLNELLKCDYITTGAKGNRPEFFSAEVYNIKEIKREYNLAKDERFEIVRVNPYTMERVKGILTAQGKFIKMNK